jgi:HK97 family phage portal protein
MYLLFGRIANLFERKAATLAEPDADLFALFGAPVSNSGIAVTPSLAMRCAPVAAATAIISSTLATLPAKVFIRTDGGGKEPDPKHPAYRLVHDDANDFTSAGELRAQLAADAMLHGDAYANRVKGRVIEFIRLEPKSITTLRRDDGAPIYRQKVGTTTRDYQFRDILYIPCPLGVSYVWAAREPIALSLRLEMHAANLFSRGGRPSGLLKIPTDPGASKKAEMVEKFMQRYSGDSSGAVALLSGNMEFTPLPFSSVDAQFLECCVFQLRQIARVWNVPVSMIGDLERSTNSNVEQQNLQFLTHTILPWLRIFTDAYRRVLFNESDRETHVVDFIHDDLLRADSATRAESISKQRAAGVLTANEARALENRPPLPGGDELSNPFISTPAKEAVPNG